MADTDTIDVKFTAQKVYHDGTSMIVAKKGDTRPVETRLIAGFIAEKVIEEPKGWAKKIAEKNATEVADGAVQVPPEAEPGADAAP